MNDKLKEFCRRYDAEVNPSSKICYRAVPVPLSVIQEKGVKDAFARREHEVVSMLEIHIPKDRFHAMLEHDDWVNRAGLQDNSFFNNNVSRVSNLIIEHERECRIRHENPAVQAAYEKYQNLLALVESHY